MLDLAFLNSSYHSSVCNPIDNTILACQTMPGHEQHFADLLTRYQKADEIPFDHSRKLVSTLVTDKNGDRQLIMKGDISQIVSRCSHVEFRGETFPMEKDGMPGGQADVTVSICRRVGIPSEIILTGADLDQLTDNELNVLSESFCA